ncbi:MAG: hypothetical protein M1118_02445 [Chloroflexi bacterium]|nr:hypothetical protein [Chloroflexota bacterium]
MASTEPVSLSSPATVAISSPPDVIVSSLRVGFSLRRLARDSSSMVAGSVLTNALSFIFSFTTTLLLVFQLDPQLVLRVVVGPHYLPASSDLPWLALALAAYSIASLLANHLLATSNRLFLLPLAIAPIVQIVLMVALSGSLLSFIHAFDAVTLGLLCCLLVIYLMPQRQHSQERH